MGSSLAVQDHLSGAIRLAHTVKNLKHRMSKENKKFQTSEVDGAMVASVLTLPPVKIESSVDAAQAHAHNQQHLATDHLLPNLRQRTISSGMTTATAHGAQSFLNLAYIMVLARLLAPQRIRVGSHGYGRHGGALG